MFEFKTIAKNFLESFDYVNKNGKRKGFILFANKSLTRDLENIATDLIKKLNALVNEQKLTDQEKCLSLIVLIKTSFDQAQQARSNRATIKKIYKAYSPIQGHKDFELCDFDYKDPYKPSKFEKELINGLTAVLSIIKLSNEELPSHFTSAFQNLISEINTFKPERVTIADRSRFD